MTIGLLWIVFFWMGIYLVGCGEVAILQNNFFHLLEMYFLFFFYFLNGIYFLGYGWVGTPQNKFPEMFSPRMQCLEMFWIVLNYFWCCCGPGTPGINFQDSFEDKIYHWDWVVLDVVGGGLEVWIRGTAAPQIILSELLLDIIGRSGHHQDNIKIIIARSGHSPG